MASSMVGFSCRQMIIHGVSISIELKSYNSRFLDISIRLPDQYRFFESIAYSHIKTSVKRGRVELLISVLAPKLVGGLPKEALLRLQKFHKDCSDFFPVRDLSLHDILEWMKSDLSTSESSIDSVLAQLEEEFLLSLEDLISARRLEGSKIQETLESFISKILDLRSKIETFFLSSQEDYWKERVVRKLFANQENQQCEGSDQLVSQEAIALALKADIREELDRVLFHSREILSALQSSEGSPIGRKLDFLVQELHREVNTLAAKTHLNEISCLAIDAKLLIESMREQIQNLE